MKYTTRLMILLMCHQPAMAQSDMFVSQILRMLDIRCDISKKDSVQEFSFGINLYVDIVGGKLDSLTVTGIMPTECNLSRPEYLARENAFLIKYLSEKKVDWKTWVASLGYSSCKKVRLVFPHVYYNNGVKEELGATFYKDFIVPFYSKQDVPGLCTLVFKPIFTGPNHSAN
jgi:hypothetical protein